MKTSIAILATLAAALAPLDTPGQDHIRPIRPIPIRRPAPPQVRATLTRIQIRVQDGVATTELVQTLKNVGGSIAEADWVLPLPPGATADGFTMTVAGKEVAGEVLDAGKARGIYEEIVRRRRDPGLLEYMGHGMLRARVFPIPANGQTDVKVRWRQVLPETAGLFSYLFPLRALGLGQQPAEKIALDLQIRSRRPLKNVWSPLPGVEIVRKDDHNARVSFEIDRGQLPPRDLEVFYGVSAKDFGLDLLTWRKASQPGHFLLMVSPKQDWPVAKNTVRVVQFVLDTSGSMQGKKIEQARNALRFFVGSLQPHDLFNVIPFSTEPRPFFDAPVAATAENIAAARAKIDAIEARGGTNIDEALSLALAKSLPPGGVEAGMQAVPIAVFLTDGLPTVGQTDVQQLLKTFRENNTNAARVFVFGVGHDVNTRLLDKIAEDTRGDRDYVRESEDIEVKTGALFDKLSHPVLTDVELIFDGIEVKALEPRTLPDLFKGSRLSVVGRYTGEGHHAIRLRGKIDGGTREIVYEAAFPALAHQHDFVGTLWAQRRIAGLLDAIRLNGANQELVEEVQRLGKEYAIVTPYTSHLIVEEGMQLAQWRGLPTPEQGEFFLDGEDDDGAVRRLREDLGRAGGARPDAGVSVFEVARRAKTESQNAEKRLADLPAAVASGEAAVYRSVQLSTLYAATVVNHDARGGVGMLSQRIAGRTLVLVGGVWTDSGYRPEMRGQERKIAAFSDEWFALLRAHPQLKKVLAFSTRLVLIVDGAPVEIVDAE